MGKNNRQRRSNKQQARRHDRATRPAGATNRPQLGSRADLESLLVSAACAAEHGTEEDFDDYVDNVMALNRAELAVGSAMVATLVHAVRTVWENGWQPADVLREVSRRRDGAVVGIARSVLAFESATTAGPGMAMPEAWSAQLHQVTARRMATPTWRTATEVTAGLRFLGLLHHLPRLPCLLPPPSQWGPERSAPPRSAAPAPGVDSRMLAKVRALLAKAESTTFDEEADSLTAKAQELMARYSIDQAMVAGTSSGEAPIGRRVGIDDPYAETKNTLLAEVARANRCSSVWSAKLGFSTVFGFAADLDSVEVLFTSLLVQATRAMTRAGSIRDELGRSHTRSYRHSFLLSFARRIGQRLQEAATQATDEAATVHGDALLPVLAGRRAEVDDAVTAAFPQTKTVTSRVTNYQGWVAGRVAADQAHLGPERQRLEDAGV